MNLNRRNFIRKIGAGSAAAGVAAIMPFSVSSCNGEAKGTPAANDDVPPLQIGEHIALAETHAGKVKGFIMRGITTFLGIPYAASAGGANRFMGPQELTPWQGVRPTVFYGNSAPQDIYSRASTSYDMFIDHWNYDEISEDCLTLNIWTPAADGKKRPVLVWLHGGGFSRGNGIEQDGYHGENLSRYGDVVFVSLNHRLGPLGFTDLSGVGGAAYADSGNAGMLDIVAALRWVNKNIAQFGGDPGNVTIAGQSGGGAKVCTLAAMPSAKGLIHKGVSLSGSTTAGISKEYAQRLGEYIVKDAGLSAARLDALQQMPWKEYLALADRASARLRKEDPAPGLRRGSFGPVADGIQLPAGNYFDVRTTHPDIPMLFCSTFHEHSPSRTNPAMENISMQEVIEQLHPQYGTRAAEVAQAYAKTFPQAKPVEVLALVRSNRSSVVEAAIAKLQQSSPVYMAWFGFCPPLFDGRMRAFHCLDISFWFLNTDLMISHSGGGSKPRQLSVKMADALLQFMRSGNPNVSALPQWPAFTAANGETMVLNETCEVQNDPDRTARKVLQG